MLDISLVGGVEDSTGAPVTLYFKGRETDALAEGFTMDGRDFTLKPGAPAPRRQVRMDWIDLNSAVGPFRAFAY
jgi:hypothetical protein